MSNLATRFITRFAKDSNAKLSQKASELLHVTYDLVIKQIDHQGY